METQKRHIKSGVEFERYFSEAMGNNELIKRNSTLDDTVIFLPEAIQRTSKQTALIAQYLKGQTKYETCENIWNWIYTHINYEKDDKGKEQIRSPRRSFRDRVRGVDCDDYTVFISSILTCLNIKHILRVAKYTERNGFQHIYPVVPSSNGDYITVDCVVDRFNYEVPFIEKKDTKMDLEFLDGIGNTENVETTINGVDAEDLMNGLNIDELGLPKLRNTKIFQTIKQGVSTAANNVKATIKTGIHSVNKVNPATALLRAGILAALKLNMFKISEKLRYAYLDTNTAARQNFDMAKFSRLVGVKDKLEKIFYGAGGTIDNFKKAILTGHGNKNKEVPVSGLGEIDYNIYNEQHSLSQILGVDSYNSEMNGIEGLGSLGEPATATAIAAATSVLAAIAGLLKSIGALKKGSKEGEPATNEANNTIPSEITSNIQTTSINDDAAAPESNTNTANFDASTNANTNGGENKSSSTDTPAESETAASTGNESNTSTDAMTTNARTSAKETTPTGTMDKIKNWVNEHKVATGLIVASAIGLTAWGISSYNKSKAAKKSKSVAGVPNTSKKSKRSKKRRKSKNNSTIKYQKLR